MRRRTATWLHLATVTRRRAQRRWSEFVTPRLAPTLRCRLLRGAPAPIGCPARLAAVRAALRQGELVVHIRTPRGEGAELVPVAGALRVRGFGASPAGVVELTVEVCPGGRWSADRQGPDPDAALVVADAGIDPACACGFDFLVPTSHWAPGCYELRVTASDGQARSRTESVRVRWGPSDAHGAPTGAESFLTALAAGQPALWWSEPPAGDPPIGRFMAVAGWAASPAGIERIEVGFASREVQARRMPVSPDLLAQLSKLVAADRVFGYLVVLDLAEVPPGERELTVRATAGDGQIAWRSGLVRVDPEERYMQWAAAHGQRRMSRRRTRRELRLRICTVPTASCDAVRLPESLECQRYRQWDVRALPEAAAQMHSDPAWMRLAGCADVAPGTLADLLRQAAEEADAVVLAAVSDRLHPDALAEFTTWLCASPTPDVIYCDEERLAEDGRATGVRLKPGWSPELLLQYDYIGSVVVLSRRGIRAALQVAGELGTAYEILLALADQSVLVERIPLALVARRPHEEPDSDAATDALQRLATRRGRELVIEADGAGGRQLRWPLHALPLVSLVIPTTGVRHLLEPCLRSLQLHTSYAPLQLILVDSGIGEAAAVADQALAGRQYEIVPYEEGGDRARFNFSHACNLGLAQARGEQVLFLNDDVEVVQADWLERMVECAGLPLTGAVGTRLVWPEGLVQHCGLALRGFGVGPPGNAYEVLAGHELSSAGPGRLLLHTHERAAVTGACLMAPRELLLRLGGWDCRFPLDFGDVDLCLRIWESGRRVLVMPSVSLRHRQSATREFVADHEGLSRFKRRWEPFFPAGDRWHHPAYSAFRDGVLELPGDSF